MEDNPAGVSSQDNIQALQQQLRWERVLSRCQVDLGFRTRLLADPVVTLNAEGIELPAGLQITVLELDPNHPYLVLPPFRSFGAVEPAPEQ